MADKPAILPDRLNVSRITKYSIVIGGIEVGSLSNLNGAEGRDITPHFTIGGKNPEDPKALIAGITRTRTLTADVFALYKRNALTVFGTLDIATDGDMIKTLKDQQTPFDIVVTEESPDPAAGDTETNPSTYVGCMLSDYRVTRDITGADVRIAESVTIVYTSVS